MYSCIVGADIWISWPSIPAECSVQQPGCDADFLHENLIFTTPLYTSLIKQHQKILFIKNTPSAQELQVLFQVSSWWSICDNQGTTCPVVLQSAPRKVLRKVPSKPAVVKKCQAIVILKAFFWWKWWKCDPPLTQICQIKKSQFQVQQFLHPVQCLVLSILWRKKILWLLWNSLV